MWWSRTACLLLCSLLTACGFRPLYVSSFDANQLSYPLKIGTIEDRNGQLLRNYLVDGLIPGGPQKKTLYKLDIVLSSDTIDIGVGQDKTSKRKQLTMTAALTLKDACHNVVYSQRTSTLSSYDILTTNYYANDVATHYTEKEAIRMLSNKIRLLISAFIDEQECAPAGPVKALEGV